MIKKISLIVIIGIGVLLARGAFAQEAAKPLNILFIGNSLTHVNGMPETVGQMALSRDHETAVTWYTPDGYTLEQHAADQKLAGMIASQAWDVVILQEQGQRPAFADWQLEQDVYPYAKRLVEMIRQAHPQAKIIFYAAMARRHGDAYNVKNVPEAGTYEGMQRRGNAAYAKMASDNNASLAPVGTLWQQFRQQYPAVEIYADDLHPNTLGSYLVACVIYQTIFAESVEGLMVPPGVDKDIASNIQKLVSELP